MAKFLRYFLFLLWFSYLVIAAILLFTRGFLLSRDTQLINATCNSLIPRECNVQTNTVISSDDFSQHCLNTDKLSLMNELHEALNVCLPQKAKVVLLIIDALRYDFTVFNSSNKDPLAFQNKLPIINTLLNTKSDFTRLYKFIADPPTTTMQRLKALTTGSLPTFIDAGSNFATAEINEDNLIDQIVKQNMNVVFMGDDTWVSLYPNRFVRSYPYPSFNVFDLDTVDNGVVTKLYPELENKDWNLLIAHFLGVDHCGHRYGPLHSEMTRKLSEMNEIIGNVVNKLDEDTMLFVIGDHGMTSTGDHGGDSTDEVTSAMFVYSKLTLISKANYTTTVTKQVDLVPTLSTILGVPIPYSNLGALVVDSLPANNENILNFPEWQILLFSIWSNVQQMTKYIKQYAISSETFSIERLQILYEKFALLNARVRTISEKDTPVFIENANEYMKMLRNMCEEVWVQFDSFSMSRGLVLIFMTIFLVYMVISGIPTQQLMELFMSSFLGCSYIALIFATVVSFVCFYLHLVDNLISMIFFSTGITSVFMLSILVIQNWDVIAIQWYNLSKSRTSMDFVCRLIFLLSWCGLLSNSYIVEEGNVSLYLLITILFLIAYENTNIYTLSNKKSSGSASNIKPKWNWMKLKILLLILIACILIRLSTIFWKCREEQQWCAEYFMRHVQGVKFGIVSANAEYLISLVMMAIFVTVTRNLLRSWGNLAGFSSTVIIMRYAPTVMVVSIGGYWVLHKLPKDTKSKLMAGLHIDYLAWVVYAFGFIGIVSILVKPLCVHIIQNIKKDLSPVYSDNNVIPQLFNQIKGLFNKKSDDLNDSSVPVIYGLATVYSAAFVAVSVYVCLLLVLLLGDILAPSLILLYFASAIVLLVSAASRYNKLNSLAQLFEVPNSSILAWMLLSVYFFYATGHQATFPNISWEAAFIGTGENFSNNFIPASLVIVNTFGSYILMGLSLPLLIIIPFTIHIVFPSIVPKNFISQKDTSRGEMLLYENDEMMLSNAFVVSCKYILYHAFRIFICMLAATIHCRHLMVWKIFAPKLIFEAIGILVTLTSVLLGYLFLSLINSKVDNLVTSLRKQSR